MTNALAMMGLKNVNGVKFAFVDGIVISIWPARYKANNMPCFIFRDVDASLTFAIVQTSGPSLLALLVRHVRQELFRYNSTIGCPPGINVYLCNSGSVLQGRLPDDHVWLFSCFQLLQVDAIFFPAFGDHVHDLGGHDDIGGPGAGMALFRHLGGGIKAHLPAKLFKGRGMVERIDRPIDH